VDEGPEIGLEANIFDFDGDGYDAKLAASLWRRSGCLGPLAFRLVPVDNAGNTAHGSAPWHAH
jgi:hypothetical protein